MTPRLKPLTTTALRGEKIRGVTLNFQKRRKNLPKLLNKKRKKSEKQLLLQLPQLAKRRKEVCHSFWANENVLLRLASALLELPIRYVQQNINFFFQFGRHFLSIQ